MNTKPQMEDFSDVSDYMVSLEMWERLNQAPKTSNVILCGLNDSYSLGLDHALKICLDSQTLKEAIARIEALKFNQDV